MSSLKKIVDISIAITAGPDIYSNQGCNYDHIFPAIAEISDNVRDLVYMKTNCGSLTPTTKLDITITTFEKQNKCKFAWNFINNGNGISLDNMRNFVFSVANSIKNLSSQIGRYGIGLKGGAMYLGDYFFVFSIDACTHTRTIGFYSDKLCKSSDRGIFLCELFDINNKTFEVMFNAIKKYSHINTIQEIEKMFADIDQCNGGTYIQIGVSNDTYTGTYGLSSKDFCITQNDIIVRSPYKGSNFKDTNMPRFCTSLRAYLQMLYLYNPEFPWEINLFGEKIEFLKLHAMEFASI